ncbi:MAG: hypothetical protein LBM04_05500 [Opitutaceae bacterium]|jgi:hypothetical protein|nr:hypothetical protein [Opitutaceae bacterium]
MWKHILLFVPLFFAGMLLDCLLEPGGVVSFRDRKPAHNRGKPDSAIIPNTVTDKMPTGTGNVTPARELTRAERRAILDSLSPEEKNDLLVEQTKIIMEATGSPRGKEGYILNLHEDLRQYFDLFFKYNQISEDVRKKTLDILANWGFESAESLKTAAVTTGKTFTNEGSSLNQEIKEKRRAELLQIMDEDMAEKIAYMSDTRALFPELLQTWESSDRLAAYMKENSAPLESRQVCSLVDVLTGARANPNDDSIRDAICALLTSEQVAQFENYRREENLLAETKIADEKSEQRLRTLFSKSGSNKAEI